MLAAGLLAEDGSYVVTGSNDSTVKVWQFNKNTNSIALFKTMYVSLSACDV